MRASYVALLWQGARGLYPEALYYRPEQDPAGGGYLRPPLANPGAADHADQGLHPEDARSPGRDGRDRGATHVHADAGCGEAEFPDDHFRFHRFLPAGEDARGVHEPHQA